MLVPFKLGLGGPIGSGKQWMSWIALGDLVRVLTFSLDTATLQGPVNAVTPQPVTNKQFAKTLGRVLRRPAVLPAPAFVVKLMFGKDCAEATALGSFRVVPKRLPGLGFAFESAELEAALRHELDR